MAQYPVIIANGFTPIPVPLDLICAQYEKRGFDVRAVPYRLANMCDVETYAQDITDAVHATLRQTGRDRVNLIGMSMGGVASLYAMKRLGLAPRVAAFVAMASPFRGSKLALLGATTVLFTIVGDQLSPGSAFLAALHADPLPTGPRYVALAGTRDRICPTHSALLDGAEHHPRPFSHFDLFGSLMLHAFVEQFLE